MPSAPRDLIKLWQDYTYIYSFVDTLLGLEDNNIMTLFSAQDLDSPVPELLPILVAMAMLLGRLVNDSLLDLRAVPGITWEKLRETICSLRPNIARDEIISADPFLDALFSEAHHRQIMARDLAQRYIHLIKSNEADDLPEDINMSVATNES
jgi:hypothetical protein